MNRYVKKPIAIEAVKWKGFNNDEIKDFAGDSKHDCSFVPKI